MSEQETSTSISPHSIPSLPPLPPSPSHCHNLSRRHATDVNQRCITSPPPPRRTHRRSHSEIPYQFATIKDAPFVSEAQYTLMEREPAFQESLWHKSKPTSIHVNVKEETQWGNARDGHLMEAVSEREVEVEGGDDLFSMYIDVDKIENLPNSSASETLDNSNAVKRTGKEGISGNPTATSLNDGKKIEVPCLEKQESIHDVTDSNKEDSENEDSAMGDSVERDSEITDDGCKQRVGKVKRLGSSYHSRSASMDGITYSMNGVDEHDNVTFHGRHVHHQHRRSMDGSLDFKHNLNSGVFDGAELEKIMANDKLAEIASVDPKRAKR